VFAPLTAEWTVRALDGDVPRELLGQRFPATVPGCVTTDLLADGVIVDPYVDENEASCAWIGRTRWEFATEFELVPSDDDQHERIDLVCLGLDTVAMIAVNGQILAETCNMHRSYRFDVGHLVSPGRNSLTVVFDAPVSYAERASKEIGPRPHVNLHPFNAVRKMASSFGWDWGPDLACAGIWRPIGIERWHTARIGSVRPAVEVDFDEEAGRRGAERAREGRVVAHVDVERASKDPLVVTARIGDVAASVELAPDATCATVQLTVPDVAVWWPVGYGAQPLYELDVDVSRPGAAVVDRWHGRVGFRTVELDTSIDTIGHRFAIAVNGVEIAVRGANWIPDDCFVSRVDRARYAERLTDAVQANMNLLRVWGGGIYESDDFYDLADELGLLVWQDFLFACASYAEEEPLRSEIVAEATEAISRLAAHPSLVLWNGCNENLWGHEDWGWKQSLGDQSWGAGYYFEILPEIVGRLDPSRPYSAGSPWSFSHDIHPNDPDNGTMHVWDVWNQRDYSAYREYAPRFVSEFGFQGPPAWSTLVRAVHDQPLAVDGAGLRSHQKAEDGMAKLARGLAPHFPLPRSMEDWHWATSLNQARAVTVGIEHWRSLTPRCAGTIVWQLNDCWPVVSWAAVDGDGRRKPLWYALRHSYAPLLLTIQPRDDDLALVVVNDSGEAWSGAVRVARTRFDGVVTAEDEIHVAAEPGEASATVLSGSLARSHDVASEVLVADVRDGSARRALWFYAEDKDLAFCPQDLDVKIDADDGRCLVHVRATGLHRDVALLADKVHPSARVDEMLVTLLDGETTTFEVVAQEDLDWSQCADPSVLKSANQLLHALPHGRMGAP